MQLWMIGRAPLVDCLRDAGELTVDPAQTEPGFSAAYAWLRGAMRRRIPGYRGGPLWWGWHTIDSVVGKRPDLRQRYWAGTPWGSPWVRLGLEVPDEDVLLCDFDLWHAVLNEGYCAVDEAEYDAWYARYAGTCPEDDPQMRAALEASWERIFVGERVAFDPAWVGRLHKRAQGTFEVLRWRDVHAVTYFRSRPWR